MFAWISTIFACLIIGCAIRYSKTGNLRYVATCIIYVRINVQLLVHVGLTSLYVVDLYVNV